MNARAIRNWALVVPAGDRFIGHLRNPLLAFSEHQILSREAIEIPAHKRVGRVLGQFRKVGRFASIRPMQAPARPISERVDLAG